MDNYSILLTELKNALLIKINIEEEQTIESRNIKEQILELEYKRIILLEEIEKIKDEQKQLNKSKYNKEKNNKIILILLSIIFIINLVLFKYVVIKEGLIIPIEILLASVMSYKIHFKLTKAKRKIRQKHQESILLTAINNKEEQINNILAQKQVLDLKDHKLEHELMNLASEKQQLKQQIKEVETRKQIAYQKVITTIEFEQKINQIYEEEMKLERRKD